MKTQLTNFSFPNTGQRIVRVDFDATTFQPDDLLWLPHHPRLSNAVIKRKAEHLAGRIAASEALRFHGVNDYVPGIGLYREPCWPPGFTGSITHSGNVAFATVVADSADMREGIGIDYEEIIAPNIAEEIHGGIIDCAEKELLRQSPYPFHYALTMAFCAKESLFKAMFRHVGRYFDFSYASISKIDDTQLILTLNHSLGSYKKGNKFMIIWNNDAGKLITLIQLGRQ